LGLNAYNPSNVPQFSYQWLREKDLKREINNPWCGEGAVDHFTVLVNFAAYGGICFYAFTAVRLNKGPVAGAARRLS
jgi:hypothetical protein